MSLGLYQGPEVSGMCAEIGHVPEIGSSIQVRAEAYCNGNPRGNHQSATVSATLTMCDLRASSRVDRVHGGERS